MSSVPETTECKIGLKKEERGGMGGVSFKREVKKNEEFLLGAYIKDLFCFFFLSKSETGFFFSKKNL